MKTALYAIVITGILTISGVGSAWAKQLEDRLAMQHRRISHGVSSGLLIKSEARELRLEHRMIRDRFKIARSDGVLTHIERRHLKFLLDRASRNICRLKQNQLIYRPNPYEKAQRTSTMQRGRT